MACFAGSIAHRGIRVIRIPTTVVSQGDSGVGVKSGVNLLGKKSFIGTFAPPFGVINASEFIDILPYREKIGGVVEAVKVALICDQLFFASLEERAPLIAAADPEVFEALIHRSAELHLRHIETSGDPFESGSARPLDFGHWAAHKLEMMTAHRLRHGEAVAIGMALDVVYSVNSGYLEPACAERVLTLLETLGLRVWDEALLRQAADGSYEVLAGLREFREHLGGRLHVTLVRQIGHRFEVNEMDEALVVACIHELRRRGSRPQDLALGGTDPYRTSDGVA